jgi:hypothetical protein
MRSRGGLGVKSSTSTGTGFSNPSPIWEPFLVELQAEQDAREARQGWRDHYWVKLARRGRGGTCCRCGAAFLHSHPRPVKYCSKRCLPVYQTGRARVVQAARPCTHCGADYVPTRRDSRFCSGTCRVAAHRLRKRAAL